MVPPVCLEILDEILSQPWTLSAASLGDSISDADLCIWDYQTDVRLPNYDYSSSSKHLYLVSRKDLPEFRRQMAVAEAHILLKPVTPVTLAAFLGFAVSSRGN